MLNIQSSFAVHFLLLFLSYSFTFVSAKTSFEGDLCGMPDGKKMACPALQKELRAGKNALVLDRNGNCWLKIKNTEWQFTWCPRKKDYTAELSNQERFAVLNYLCSPEGVLAKWIQVNSSPGSVIKDDLDETSCSLESIITFLIYDKKDAAFCSPDLLEKARSHCDAELTRVKNFCAIHSDKNLSDLQDLGRAGIKKISEDKTLQTDPSAD